jgi:hypothetical protein
MASAARHEANCLNAAVSDIAAELGAHVERMIQIQMEAYPEHWSEQDRRDMAEQHLFGRGALA